jgi:hypothetical protein
VKASEYVRHLERLIIEHGDLECEDQVSEPMPPPEHYTDSDCNVFILGREA